MRFVRTSRYLKDMKRLRASNADIEALEQIVAEDPLAGDVIPGLRGVRKLRFALGHRGKRGGGRAIYFLMVSDDLAVMLFAYSKSEKDDISPAEKRTALALITEMLDGREQ